MLELIKCLAVFEEDVNYLVDLGERQFVSTLNFSNEFGCYFDDIQGKEAIQLDDERILAIYEIKRK